MGKRSYSKPQQDVRIAKRRIRTLFEQAALRRDPTLCNRYVTLARKMGMKYKVRIPSQFRNTFCKHCYEYFIPGKTCAVRTARGKVVYTCFNCKKFTRFPYKKEQKAKRKV